jgi:RNA polymerase sigma-32 factor
MAAKSMLPALSPDGNLSRYLEQIRAFPMLEPGEEYMLAKSWKDKGDVKAAHKLVTSHLRLVAKIAMGYRGYGLPVADLISEGNLGMMHAVKKFEPEKGFRLATYAMWWIKAAIQEYILAVMVTCQNRYHRRAKETVFQSSPHQRTDSSD